MNKSPSSKSPSKKSNKLRYSPPTVELCNIPNETEVYTVGGHGCQYDTYETVPDGCIYVSLALCGSSISIVGSTKFDKMFEEKSPLLKNPCTTFRKLNKILTETIDNPEYNDNTHMELITPDEKYDKTRSTYLNIHYNDTLHTNKFNQYLEVLYSMFGYSIHKDDVCVLWKSGLHKMSNDNLEFSHGMTCLSGFYKEIILHHSDIEFLYKDSILPTLKNVLDMIAKFKLHQYYRRYDRDPPMPVDIDKLYFEDKTLHNSEPRYITRIYKYKYENFKFEPLISLSDFKNIMKHHQYTQNQLFKKYPGIYYNTTCRSVCSGFPNESRITIQKQKSVDNKSKLFKQLHELESKKYFQNTEARTFKFKRGVEIGDTNRPNSQFNIKMNEYEKEGSNRFNKAEKYGHKMSTKKRKMSTKKIIPKLKSLLFTKKNKSLDSKNK